MSALHSGLTGGDLHNVKQHNHDADTEAGGGKLTGAVVDTYVDVAEAAAPGTPAAGHVRLYAKADGNLYQKDDAGAETGLAGGGGGGAPTDATYVVEDSNGTLSAESVLGTTVVTRTAYASRQAAAKSGRLHFPTDGYAIARDDGAAWAEYGPLFPFTPPVDGDFAWTNQGGATVSTSNGGIYLAGPATAAHSWRIRRKAAPTPPYTVTIGCIVNALEAAAVGQFALGFRQSSDGKLALTYGIVNAGAFALFSSKWTSETALSANYAGNFANVGQSGPLFWLQISDDNTNRVCRWSATGRDWHVLHSVGRTDFLTADQVLFAVSAPSASLAVGLLLLSWKEE